MLLSLCFRSRPVVIFRVEVCKSDTIPLHYAKPTSGMTKFVMTLKSFEVEIQPFIKDMNEKEGFIREYADAATMERVRSMISHMMMNNGTKSNSRI